MVHLLRVYRDLYKKKNVKNNKINKNNVNISDDENINNKNIFLSIRIHKKKISHEDIYERCSFILNKNMPKKKKIEIISSADIKLKI